MRFYWFKITKSIKSLLKTQKDTSVNLWITNDNNPLTYWGLNAMVRNRAKQAKVNVPSIHSFRRWFALTCLREGINIYSLQTLMGHSDLQVLKRYLKQTSEDIKKDIAQIKLVDNLRN